MKTIKKIIIFLIVVIAILIISYIAYENGITPTLNNTIGNEQKEDLTNKETNLNSKNEKENSENTEEQDEYVGKEEQESQEDKEDEKDEQKEQNKQEELTGENKAVQIVTQKFATNGETVRFDHMENDDYVIGIKNGTGATWWYIVDGQTWEAEEY